MPAAAFRPSTHGMYRSESLAAHERIAQLEHELKRRAALPSDAPNMETPSARVAKPASVFKVLLGPYVVGTLVSAAIAAGVLYWIGTPKAQTVMRTNAGHSVSVLFRTDVSDVVVKTDDGESLALVSAGFSDLQTPLGGGEGASTPSRVVSVLLPPSRVREEGPTQLHVTYKTYGFVRHATVSFESGKADLRFAKATLESMPHTWAAFRTFGGRDLVYFSTVLSYKYAIREIRYGWDDEPVSHRVNFKASNAPGVDVADEIYTERPPHAQKIRMQIEYKDGSTSELHEVSKIDATIP